MGKVDRPNQYKQASRKGKKAWRKNIDLTDIEKSIESKVELEITHGTSNISDLADKSLFKVDTDGDEVLKSKLIKRKQIKKGLKSSEILDSIKTNSKVSALLHRNHGVEVKSSKNKKTIQGVSKNELNKLMALAGKRVGESKLQNRLDKEGLVKSSGLDLWGTEDTTTTVSTNITTDTDDTKRIKTRSGIVVDVHKSVTKNLIDNSTTGWSVASEIPETLKQKPIQIREFNDIPHAGKSYNPSKNEWSSLISKEFETEKVKEEQRLKLEAYKEKIKHLMETIDDTQEVDSESDEDDENDENDEDEDEDEDVTKLSLNAPTKNKKKTKYQRNKARKHEEKVKIQQELKKLREQVKELEKIEHYDQEIQDAASSAPVSSGKIDKKRKHNRNKLGSKYGILDERLEVKFSDELSDSLRKLKPEGNLLYENVRKLQSAGKIESRIPIKNKRSKKKITEKWTYKDFK